MTLTDTQRAAIRSDAPTCVTREPFNDHTISIDGETIDPPTVRALMRLGEIVVSRLQNEEGYGLVCDDVDGLLEALAAELEKSR